MDTENGNPHETQRAAGQLESMLDEHGMHLRDGHFVVDRDTHSAEYVNFDLMLCDHGLLQMTSMLAVQGIGAPPIINTILAINTAGAIMGPSVAAAMKETYMITALNAFCFVDPRRDGPAVVLPRNYQPLVYRRRVLILELMHKPEYAKRVVAALQKLDAHIVGLLAIFSGAELSAKQLDVPKVWNTCLMPTFPESDCPLCKRGMPMRTDFGEGQDWLLFNPDYPTAI